MPRRFVALLLLIVLVAPCFAAAPVTRPTSSTAPSTAPTDPATVLLWMGAELDGLKPGTGSDRLQDAATLAITWRMKSSIPYFMEMYDGATSPVELKNRAALAVIQIDPEYSFEFFRELIRNEYLALHGYQHTVHAIAARLLAEHGDGEARQFLLEGYQGFLNDLGARRGTNFEFAGELELMRDPAMAEALAKLRPNYAKDPLAKPMLEAQIEQMTFNAKSVDELLKLAENTSAPEESRRRALVAVNAHYDEKSLARIEALADALDSSTTKPTTQELNDWRQLHPVMLRADGPQLASVARKTAVSIRGHFRPVTQPTSQPAIAVEPLPDIDGVPPGVVACMIQNVQSPNNRVAEGRLTVRSLDGFIHYDVKVRDPAVMKQASALPRTNVAIFQPADDWTEVRWIGEYAPQVAEAAPNCWTFVREIELPNDRWKHRAVVLRKLGTEITAAIPIRSREGKNVPDTRIAAAVEPLKPGTMVEVRFEKVGALTTLRYIAPYRPSIPAKFIAWHPKMGFVDLEIARRRRTFRLPELREMPNPDVMELLHGGLRPGDALRVVIENADDSQPLLREIAVAGYIAERPPENWLMVVSGRPSLQCNKRGDAYDGFIAIGGVDDEASRVRLGLSKMLDDEKLRSKWIRPEQIEPLRAARVSSSNYSQQEVQTLLALLTESRDPETPVAAQELAVQKMYLALQGISHRADAADAQQVKRVRDILKDEQYSALVDAGRINPKPRLGP